MQKCLGVVREAWDSTSSCHCLRLTQGDCTAKILEDAVKLGFGRIRVCTTGGQSVSPPDPKLLPVILGCASSLEVCCSCHDDMPVLSHACASGLERKSDTFSLLLHTLLNGLSS